MSKGVRAVVGIVLVGVGIATWQPWLIAYGASLTLGAALEPRINRLPLSPQTATLRGSNLPGKIIYGFTRTAGMLYVPAPGTSGEKNKYLHYIIVLAAHEVQAITNVWLDQEAIPEVQIQPDGEIATGKFAGKLLVEKYLGTEDQAASQVLVDAFSEWDDSFRGRGVAYLHLRFERDDEVFSGGPPQHIYAQVRGKKVLDPRSGLTAFSDNPALCLRDYLVNHCDAEVDESYVIAAANICDEIVHAGAKRYRCAGIADTGVEPKDNIEDLLSAMNGAITFSGGKFRIFAGAYTAPTKTIDASWLAGSVTLQVTSPGRSTYNTVRASFIDPARNYQVNEAEPQTSATYVELDGRELERDLPLPFTPSNYQAQRQAFQILLQSRGQRLIEAPLNLKALDLAVWDTVFVNLPDLGINEIYRVIQWQYGNEIKVMLREESEGYYQEPSYAIPTELEVVVGPRESPNSPNNLTIAPGSGGVQLTWTNPPARQFDQIEIWRSPDSAFANAVRIATVRASSYWDAVPTADTWFYWIRARNASGQFSDYIPDITGGGSGGGTAPPGDGSFSASLSASTIYADELNGNSITTQSVTCYPVNGTAPYTYAWERVSGSTDISISSPSAATTAFSAAAAADTNKSAVFKCVVTDATPATVDSPNLTVSMQWIDLSGGFD